MQASLALLRQLEDENAELAKRMAEQDNENKAMKNQLKINETALEKLTNQLDQTLNNQTNIQDDKVQALKAQIATLEVENKKLQREVHMLRKLEKDKSNLVAEMTQEVETVIEEKEVARTQIAVLEKKLKTQAASTKEIELTNQNLAIAMGKLEERMNLTQEAADDRVSDWLAERQRLRGEAKQAHGDKILLKRKLIMQQARATSLNDRLKLLQSSLRHAPPSSPSSPSEAASLQNVDPDAGAEATQERDAPNVFDPSTVRRLGAHPSQVIKSAALGDVVPIEHFQQLEREVRKLRKQVILGGGRGASPRSFVAESSPRTPKSLSSTLPTRPEVRVSRGSVNEVIVPGPDSCGGMSLSLPSSPASLSEVRKPSPGKLPVHWRR